MLHAERPRVRFVIRSLDFSIDLIFQLHYGPGVDPVFNRNEYQKSSWVVNGGRRIRLTTSPPSVSLLGVSTSHNSNGPPRPVTEIALHFLFTFKWEHRIPTYLWTSIQIVGRSRPYTSESWGKVKSLETACICARRKFNISSFRRYGLIHGIQSLTEKSRRGNDIRMILEWFSFPGKIKTFWSDFFTDFCRCVRFSVPELKLMTSRKYDNSRLLGTDRIQKFPHETTYYVTKKMEYCIIDSQ
jgi:hypothetical protein